MEHRIQLLVISVGLLVLGGCAGTGEVIKLDVRALPSPAEAAAKKGEAASVAVVAFEDQRSVKGRLGSRTHLWGGETYFDVEGGKPGEVIAQVVADYLKQKGWDASMVKPGMSQPASAPGVSLSGQVLDLTANAKSKFFSTEITVKSKVAVQALNRDGSAVRMTLNGAGSQSVFWFEPEDVQELVNAVLKDSLAKLVSDTKVENGLLQLR